MKHSSMFGSAGLSWAVLYNRELASGMNDALAAQFGAMSRKLALRAQQMTFCAGGQSPYMRCAPEARHLPC
jgi:hypothetical protein